MDYAIGSRIGDYEILAVLGAGGMGKVYRVRNVLTERQEALKVLLMNAGNEQDLADRFLREIKVTARLMHPNIAGLHTALHVDNQLLMVMEFVEGTTLERLLKPGPVPHRKAMELICQVLDALDYAHRAGVVHRDLKPANMMVTADWQVKLLDFGIAKIKQDQSLTKTGFTVGSLPYMSPEQIEGATDLDQRADIYALGISLYETVTGRRPFQGDSDYSLMVAHLKQAPVPPIEVDPSLPKGLSDIILTAIEKDREKRFQTAGAMLNAMRNVLGDRGRVVPSEPATATMATPVPVVSAAAAPAPPPVAAAAPPPVMAPAPEFAPQPPVARPPASPGHRGLYVALGSAVTVVVLVVAAIQIPKYFQAQAETGKARTVVESEAPRAADPVQTPQTPVTQTAQTGGPAPQTAAQQQIPQSQSVPETRREMPAQKQPDPAPTQSQQYPPQQPQQQYQQTPPAVTQPAVDTAKEAELQKLNENLMLLGTRANSVKSSLERMKQAQERQGLGMRGDISVAEQQMEYFLDQCEGAVKKGDPSAAKRYLQNAERLVSKLEDFLGR